MIIHPDGRLEGTPEELLTYQRETKIDFNFKRVYPDSWWSIFPPSPYCGGGATTGEYIPQQTFIISDSN